MSKLNIVPGDYGLISMDPECSRTALLTRLVKLPFVPQYSNSYSVCCVYSTPSLVTGTETATGYDSVSRLLKRNGRDIDAGLTPRQTSEVMALNSMALCKLRPLLEFAMWSDKRNNGELINPWYMKTLRLPFNHSYTKNKKKITTELIESLYPLENDQENIKEYLIREATDCLKCLSDRLGTNDFFLGKAPTSIDVLVYTYFGPFMKIPFVSIDITKSISDWPNLEQLVKKIDAKYVSDLLHMSKDSQSQQRQTQQPHNDDEVSYSAIFIMSLSTISLLVAFAVNKGLIRL